jgi:hypothetical protein
MNKVDRISVRNLGLYTFIYIGVTLKRKFPRRRKYSRPSESQTMDRIERAIPNQCHKFLEQFKVAELQCIASV